MYALAIIVQFGAPIIYLSTLINGILNSAKIYIFDYYLVLQMQLMIIKC